MGLFNKGSPLKSSTLSARCLLAIATACLAQAIAAAPCNGTPCNETPCNETEPGCEATSAARQRFQRPATIPHPANNPYSEARAELGRQLFFDPRLSRDNDISCATCHQPALGWEDGRATALGTDSARHRRHTPTIHNLAWAPALLWDGRTPTLESQVWFPLTAHDEMAQDVRALAEELAAVPAYAEAFAALFPGRGISLITVSAAIATFERTVVTGETAFDRWVAGDDSALDDTAKRGFALFVGKARCDSCHSGWNFSDGQFHDIGLPAGEDVGRFMFTRQESDRFAFKTPGLRNITLRAPYMHDGSIATLRQVLEHYNQGFQQRPSLSSHMQPLHLDTSEINDLLHFLEALDSDDDIVVPQLPPRAPAP
ncbi:cytochrome-c peroxidase [Parahaliea mediterranea]|uniref:Methylamine utilization protein MauG n=1 Tax=Parahaliea mediterranea TaxID=651086 RepID=A0A939ILF1_9GAMM|nr:cytochrome c peroxidase [Parahaliea mediterranea]MBN7798331.1 c-type cytochrome [Parahaliea mediterranea]